jgi:SAM-dependent methyltransferase
METIVQRVKYLTKQIIKKVYCLIDPLRIFIYRRLHNFSYPIPPAINRMRVGSRTVSQFMRSGKNCYDPINDAINLFYKEQKTKKIMLDFGAGVGRTLHYFNLNDNYLLYACDVDLSAVEYLTKSFPKVQVSNNKFEPPLIYPSDFFDIIYSVSVWTHLPLNLQEPWLDEMHRILKPGGLALITIIGVYGYKRKTHLQAVNYSCEELISEGIKYCDYKDIENNPGVGKSYGATYQTIDYTRNHWNKKFSILDIQEGIIDNLNDLVILRK